MATRVHIGQMLIQEGLIDEAQLRSALALQRKWGGRLGQALLRLRLVSEERLLATVARQLGIPFVLLGPHRVPPHVLALLPERIIRGRNALPLEVIEQPRPRKLVVAFSAPEDLSIVDDVAFAAGMEVRPVLAGEDDLRQAIARHLDVVRGEPREAIELPDEPTGPMHLVDGREIQR